MQEKASETKFYGLNPDPKRRVINTRIYYGENHDKVAIFIGHDLMDNLRGVRHYPEGLDCKGVKIGDREILFDSGPAEILFDGKICQMDTAKDNFGNIIGQREAKDSERMSPQAAKAEAALLRYYAEALHNQRQKEMFYKTDEITAQEYKIADDFLTSWSLDAKRSFIGKLRKFIIQDLVLGKIYPTSKKLGKIEKNIGLISEE